MPGKNLPDFRTIDELTGFRLEELVEIDKPRIRVDFNELAQDGVVLLSKTDEVTYSDGNRVTLTEGLAVAIYEYNHYDDGLKEFLLADGFAELNDPNENGEWTKNVKWCCRINENGIIVNSS